MPSEEDLKSLIRGTRKVSDDGSLVTYNLTKGIDFSHPRKTAEALAEVFFEMDAVNWFRVQSDNIEFNPTYKVRILLADDHSKKVEEIVDDFLTDLKKGEISDKFGRKIDEIATHLSGLKAAMVAGTFTSLLTKHYGRQVDIDEIKDDIFTDILEKIEIKSPTDKDLMDWEHLPI